MTMHTSSHCACRTAALRIFVRSLVGPVPSASTRAAASRAPTAAARQWRSLITTNRPSMSRFQSATTNATTTRAFHVSRRLLGNAQLAEQVETTAIKDNTARHEDTRAVVEGNTGQTEVAATNSAPANDDVVQPLQSVVEDAETEHLRAASAPLPAEAQAADATPGKNMRKRIRRQKEVERLAAEAAEAAVAAAGGTADPAEAAKLLKKLKPKKEKKEKKSKLEKFIEERDAKKKAKKDIRRERRALEKAAASGATAAPPSEEPKPKSKSNSKATEQPDTPSAPPPTKDGKPAKSTPAAASKSTLRPLPKDPEPWQVQKRALREKFPEGWNPRKKLSPDALEGIRALHRQFPQVYTTAALAGHFQVSSEAIRRILKSKWQAKPEEEEDRQARWFERGKQVWSRWAELGRKPPKRWQAEGILRESSSWSGGRRRLQEREPGISRTRQIIRQTRQNRQNFQVSLSEEGVLDNGSVPSAAAMRRAIKSSGDVDAPTRSVSLSSEQRETLRKATRSQSTGRLARLRRSGKVDAESAEE